MMTMLKNQLRQERHIKAVLTPMGNHKPGNPVIFDHLNRTVNPTSVGNYPDHNSDSDV